MDGTLTGDTQIKNKDMRYFIVSYNAKTKEMISYVHSQSTNHIKWIKIWISNILGARILVMTSILQKNLSLYCDVIILILGKFGTKALILENASKSKKNCTLVIFYSENSKNYQFHEIFKISSSIVTLQS